MFRLIARYCIRRGNMTFIPKQPQTSSPLLEQAFGTGNLKSIEIMNVSWINL
jgi:hypothetical protein